jgi:hypothetical protein
MGNCLSNRFCAVYRRLSRSMRRRNLAALARVAMPDIGAPSRLAPPVSLPHVQPAAERSASPWADLNVFVTV